MSLNKGSRDLKPSQLCRWEEWLLHLSHLLTLVINFVISIFWSSVNKTTIFVTVFSSVFVSLFWKNRQVWHKCGTVRKLLQEVDKCKGKLTQENSSTQLVSFILQWLKCRSEICFIQENKKCWWRKGNIYARGLRDLILTALVVSSWPQSSNGCNRLQCSQRSQAWRSSSRKDCCTCRVPSLEK